MPVASTSKRVDRRAVAKRPRRGQIPRARPSKMLRVITEPETHALRQALLHAPSMLEYNFDNLEKPCEYPFKARDLVWVRTKGDKWMSGKVSGRVRVGPTRNEQGFWYHVNFGPKFNVRKYFAPLNGEIKPDTHEVRQLLRDEGWIATDSEMSDDSHSEYTE